MLADYGEWSDPIAAFTIKHELIRWLRGVEGRLSLAVFRLPDNPRRVAHYFELENAVRIDVRDLLARRAPLGRHAARPGGLD